MLIKSVIQKVLAFFLVFTLTFANIALVTKSYASTLFASVFSSSSGTGGNVEFDAYFDDTGQGNSYSANSDLNADSVMLNLSLSVVESGYLKNAQIAILEQAENSGLNFKVNSQIDESSYEYAKSFKDNVLKLKQIPSGSGVNLRLPLVFENEEFMKLSKLDNSFIVELTGTYVNAKGKEVEINKKVSLSLAWQDNREIKLSSEVTKCIPMESGILLQTLITVDSRAEKSGAVKETNLEIQMPRVKGGKIENIFVTAKSTEGTDGKKPGNVEFSEENWKYEDGLLTINKKNNPVNDNEYYSKSGVDEYLVTYLVKGITLSEEKLNSKVKAIVTTYGTESIENKKEQKFYYDISKQIGNLVTYELQNETKDLSKGYMYYKYNDVSLNKSKIEFNYKSIINVSDAKSVEEINVVDESNYYIDKDNNEYELDDVYYSEISISKDNFEKILGENGEIKIIGKDDNEIGKITKENGIVNDKNYVYYFGKNIQNQIKLKISKPLSDGNLIFNIQKIQTKSIYDKNLYQTFSKMRFNSLPKVKYSNIENLVEGEEKNIEIELNDTITKADLILSTNTISTFEETDVEMIIKLNNEKIESDIYGNGLFEILLPEYVENLEITDYNIANGPGLELESVEKVQDENNNFVIRATIKGLQNGLSPGILTNGTNIIINTKIKLNELIPKMEKEIVLKYTNSEATNYFDSGTQTQKITYSAPSGVISINSLNYNERKLSSVNEGTKYSTIATNSSSINSKMDIIVMNNNTNKISDISILGRIPKQETTNIITNENLGTTNDVILTSKIVSDINNDTNFKIYYSSNGAATTNLENPSNGWSEEMNLEDIKSYLIIPEDENYELDVSKVLKFSYEFLIPENLEFNNNFCGYFGTYYKNNKDDSQYRVAESDQTILTTGNNPELVLETKIDSGQTISEKEELTITSKVTNTGQADVKDVRIKIPIPEGTSKSYYSVLNDEILVSEDKNCIIYNIPKLEKEASEEVSLKVLVNSVDEEKTLNISSSIISDSNEDIITDSKEVLVNKAKLSLEVETKAYGNRFKMKESAVTSFKVIAKNESDEDFENVNVKVHVDNKFQVLNLFVVDPQTEEIEELTTYNKKNGDILINFNTIKSNNQKQIAVNLKAKALQDNSIKETSYIYATADGNNIENVKSNSVEYTIGKPIMKLIQTTNTPNYVRTEDMIEYEFLIENEGSYTSESFNFECNIPECLSVNEITMIDEKNEIISSEKQSLKGIITKTLEVGANKKLIIKIDCRVLATNQAKCEITNKATITSECFGKVESNEITHIVEDLKLLTLESLESNINQTDETLEKANGPNIDSNLRKQATVTGIVWIDENSNGARDKKEKLLSDTKVSLLDANTGQIVDTVITDSGGKYSFDVEALGDYIVLFEYDSGQYSVSAYQKNGVAESNNSDVISTNVAERGLKKAEAVTETITLSRGTKSNVDMGLVQTKTFDLELTNTVSKIIIQNNSGTKEYDFDKADLAKIEIIPNDLSSSIVNIEYTIIIKNNGDVDGYAKEIVNYISDGLEFDQKLNPDWYVGDDGNIYTKALAKQAIATGKTKKVKLILTKQMTEDNTGLINNTAEIFEDYNDYGLKDINSSPANKLETENDFGAANVIISVRTGGIFIYTSVLLTTILLGGIAVFVTISKLNIIKRKEGGV